MPRWTRYYNLRHRATGWAHDGSTAATGDAAGFTARNGAALSYDPLFEPPTLTSPVTRTLSSASRTASGGSTSQDMIVQSNGSEIVGPVVIKDARNVIVNPLQLTINGQIPVQTSTSAIPTYRTLAFNNITGIVYIVGLYIKPGEGVSEGIQAFGSNGATFIYDRCHVAGVRSFDGDGETYGWQHSDLLQHITGRLRMRLCTFADSVYQGIYIHASTTNAIIPEIRGVGMNIRGVRRQPFWLNGMGPGVATPTVVQLDHVWNHQRRTADGNTFPLPYSTAHTNLSYTQTDDYPYAVNNGVTSGTYTSGTVTWPSDAKFASGLTMFRGLPPDGDFAPTNKVGLNYDAAWFAAQYYG